MGEEERYQVALERAKRRAKHQGAVSFGAQKKQIRDDIIAAKIQLRRALRQKNRNGIRVAFEQLIRLRGKLSATQLEEIAERFGVIKENTLRSVARAYYTDCHTLAEALAPYL